MYMYCMNTLMFVYIYRNKYTNVCIYRSTNIVLIRFQLLAR